MTHLYFNLHVGAVGAGELNAEYDYANDYATEDYPTPGSRPIDSEIPTRHCYVVCQRFTLIA
jgi:hypothetical protein